MKKTKSKTESSDQIELLTITINAVAAAIDSLDKLDRMSEDFDPSIAANVSGKTLQWLLEELNKLLIK